MRCCGCGDYGSHVRIEVHAGVCARGGGFTNWNVGFLLIILSKTVVGQSVDQDF